MYKKAAEGMDAFSPLFKYIRTLLRLMKKRKEVTHQSIEVIDRKINLRINPLIIEDIKRSYCRHRRTVKIDQSADMVA